MTTVNLAGRAHQTRIELADVAKMHGKALVLQKVDIQTRDMSFADLNVVQQINAQSADEIIFTKGATEAINLVAHSYGCHFLKEGDEIIISQME